MPSRLEKSRNIRVIAGGVSRRGVARALTAAGLVGVVLNVVLALVPAQPAVAATGINKTINFQGKLVNSNGTNVPNGTYNIEYKLYTGGNGCIGGGTSPCGGTLVWTESRLRSNATAGVVVDDGIFQVNLGSFATLPATFNDDTIWLSINLGNTNASCTPFSSCAPDGEMLPFIRFTAAPYALNSDLLDGLSAADFAQISPASAQSGNLNVTGDIRAGTKLQAPLLDTATGVPLDIGTVTATAVTVGRATSATNLTLQGSASTTWSATGALGSTTLQFAAPTATNNITIPNAGGTMCTTVASTCSTTYQVASGTGYLLKGATDTSSIGSLAASAFGYTFTNITSAATASGILKLDNGANTGSTLYVTASGNPVATQALLKVESTNGTPSGSLLDLQVNTVSMFKVDTAGLATLNGNFTNGTNTVTTGNLAAGTAVRATSSSASAGYYSKATVAGASGWAANDVVALDSSATGVTTTTARDIRVYGVGVIARTVGQPGDVAIAGNFQVTATSAAVAIGDQLVTSTTAGQVMTDNNATTGILGTATTAKAGGSSGLVGVSIRPVNGETNPNFAGNVTIGAAPAGGAQKLAVNPITTASATTANAQVLIGSGASGNVGLMVQGAASRTVPVARFENSDGSAILEIGSGSSSNVYASSRLQTNGGVDLDNSGVNTGNITKKLTAGTGGVVTGDVVILANDGGSTRVIQTTTARDVRVYGVASSTVASGSTVAISISGNTQVTATTGAVAIGDQLVTSTTAGQVMVDNDATTGILGVATSTKAGGSSGLVGVMVRPVNGVVNPNLQGGNLTTTGTITSGLINGQTISSTANFTGTLAVATSIAAPLAVLTGATSGATVLSVKVAADTNDRLAVTAAGGMSWGPGNVAADAFLARDSAGILRTTSTGLRVDNAVSIGSALLGTTKLSIATGAIGTVGVMVQGASGQTANLLELQDNGGLVNARFNNLGNQLTLGRISGSGTVTKGALTLSDGTNSGFGGTLQLAAQIPTGTITYSLPVSSVTSQTICTTDATSCGGTTGAYVALQTITPGTAQTGNLNLSGTGIFGGSVLTPTIDAAAAGTLNLGVTTATSIAMGNAATTQITVMPNSAGNGAFTATTSLQTITEGGTAVRVGGYVYMIGGCGVSSAADNNVQIAKIRADGTLTDLAGGTTNWTNNTPISDLPFNNCNSAATSYNGYIYFLGGGNSSNSNTVYRAKPNADGTITSWTAETNTLGFHIRHHMMAAYNGWLYVIGGQNFAGSANSKDLYRARINADGTIGAFTQQAGWESLDRLNAGITIANGYLYLATSNPGNVSSTGFTYAKINTDGSVGSPTNTALPEQSIAGGLAVANGYMYLVAGAVAGPATNHVWYAPLNSNGSVGTWVDSSNDLLDIRESGWMLTANGYLYWMGGTNGSTLQTTVYMASVGRVKVGGSLDLVGYSGEDLQEGGSGGSLTAGNTIVSGSLDVQDAANFRSGMIIGGDLNVGGVSASGNVAVGTVGTTIFKNNGATFNATCAYTGVSGNITLNTAAKTPDVCTTFAITTTGAGPVAITVPAPAAGAGSMVYVSNSSASTIPFTIGTASIGVGSTASLVYINSTWSFAGADAGSLQTAYNNQTASPTPSIVANSTKSGMTIQNAFTGGIAAGGEIFGVRSAITGDALTSSPSLLRVSSYGVAVNLGTATHVTGNDIQIGDGSVTARIITVTTATGTTGANLTVRAAAGNAAGTGGVLALSGGAAGATAGAAGGGLTVAGANGTNGAGATAGGAAGTVGINGGNGGAGTGTNSSGAAGGVVSITGGTGGAATGTGTNGNGGAVSLTGGTAGSGGSTGTPTGGAATVQGGAAAAVAGSKGGAVAVTGANGSGTGAGGAGGDIVIKAGDAAGSGSTTTHGGNITLTAGTATGTGTPGVVSIDTPVFTASAQQNIGTTQTIAVSLVDSNSTVLINATAASLTITIPAPTNTAVGRIVYITATNTSLDFTLTPFSSPSVSMKANSTAALVWNGTAWTPAGADATSLQQVYNNTGTSPASIVTTSTAKTLAIQAGIGFDTTAVLAVKNANSTSALSVGTVNNNLLINSGFEGGTTNWAAKGTTSAFAVDATTGNVFHDTQSLRTVTTAATSGAATSGGQAAFSSNIAASTQYQLTFYAKCSASINTLTIGRQDVAATDVNVVTNGACTTSWQQFTAHWTTGGTITNPNIYITLGATAAGTLWIDAVSLVQTNTSAATNYNPGNIMLGGVMSNPAIFQNVADSSTAFQIQQASGVALFTVDTASGGIRIGDTTNYVQFTNATREIALNGTARHTKNLIFTAEFAGAVLDGDGTANLGTMTAAYEATQRFGYYKWVTSQGTAQDYDVVLTVPVPDDFSAWTGTPTFWNYGSAGSTMTVTVLDTAGTVATNYNASTLTTSTTWTARNVTTPAITGTYTQGSNMIIRIHMTAAATTGDVRLGTITLPYLSRW